MTQNPFEKRIAESWKPESWKDLPLVIGVSGGADSVALLRAIFALRDQDPTGLTVGHFNHGWRGEASNADQQFVEQLAQSLGIECISAAGTGEKQTEEAARAERMEFLESLVEKQDARHLVLGHHADDQIETILFRIFRGTGLEGLQGIVRARPISKFASIIRPFLVVSREDIEQYLQQLGQEYRSDVSNEDTSFRRNWIRHELLPQVREHINPKTDEAIQRLGQLAEGAQRVVHKAVDSLERVLVGERTDDEVELWQPSTPVDEYMCGEMFRRVWQQQGWSQQSLAMSDLVDLTRMLIDGEGDTRQYSGGIQASMEAPRMLLKKIEQAGR